jgi:hypothetical protein
MTPRTGDQPVPMPLPTHRTTQTQNKRTHSCLEWDSNLRSQYSSERRQFMSYTTRSLWSSLGLCIVIISFINVVILRAFMLIWSFYLVITEHYYLHRVIYHSWFYAGVSMLESRLKTGYSKMKHVSAGNWPESALRYLTTSFLSNHSKYISFIIIIYNICSWEVCNNWVNVPWLGLDGRFVTLGGLDGRFVTLGVKKKHFLFAAMSTQNPDHRPWSKNILEKLIVAQPLRDSFFGNRCFITVCTTAHHFTQSWAILIQPTQVHTIFLRSILILSPNLFQGLPSGLFSSGFPTKILLHFSYVQ